MHPILQIYGISDWVIAVTIVAAGTSAPEFATSGAAAIKGRHGIAIGNLIGSDLFNLLGVLGLAGIINPSVITKDVFEDVLFLVTNEWDHYCRTNEISRIEEQYCI